MCLVEKAHDELEVLCLWVWEPQNAGETAKMKTLKLPSHTVTQTSLSARFQCSYPSCAYVGTRGRYGRLRKREASDTRVSTEEAGHSHGCLRKPSRT